jgi:hypothetical protein
MKSESFGSTGVVAADEAVLVVLGQKCCRNCSSVEDHKAQVTGRKHRRTAICLPRSFLGV